ncbi:MAG: Fe3+-hydroxamate ABC transporter substrate-binding protein [Paracoccus denitrificans]|nr:MAG: Fe3+-hydroxamate ABC transporter substrate-binding protein [Paracoccus denitrificans]PZO86279.1 MAG: Fe3+-hydroxamate ABC transporter substrate-binding protein [Paracoccus denitrificans]
MVSALRLFLSRGAGRKLCAPAYLLSLCAFMTFAWSPARAEVTLTDADGRQVVLDAPAKRVALGEADLILSLMLLTDDPVAPIAAWGSPERLDPGIRRALEQRFPAINAIPVAGSASPVEFNIESVIATDPDLYVIRVFDPAWERVRAQLDQSGIPVIFLDSPALDQMAPDQRVAFSLSLLGKAIGKDDRAKAYETFISEHYARARSLVDQRPDRPKVLLDGNATRDCCWVPGKQNRLRGLVSFAGGEIVGSDLVPGYAGKISQEYIMAADPQVLIATGGQHLADAHGLVLGVGTDVAAAQASLDQLLATGIRPELDAVRDGRAHGIQHLLTISPLEVLAMEAFVGWIHPELADRINPNATLRELNDRFLPVPLSGALWVDQTPPAAH